MARRSVCVLFAIAASTTAATAQNARYPRQQPAPPVPVLSERVKPLVATPAALPAATKPAIDVEAVLSVDGLRGGIRAEQEQILVQLIANTPDSEVDEKTDYYFRLGELYAKQQRFWRLKTVELTAAGKQTDATRAAEKAKEFLLKAVKTFKGLTDNDAFRNYPKLDLALFYYAYTLQSGKYLKEARAVYDKLLKNYPDSKYVPEAHLAFAEYYVESQQLADAEMHYKRVLQFPKSSVYAYALYRLGWIDLQLSRPQEALETFSKVVRATRNDHAQESLFVAAKADFVRAYVATGKHDQVFSTLKTLDSKNAVDSLELFGEAAWAEGAADHVVAAYRELLSHAGGDASACLWQYRLARATLSLPAATNAGKLEEVSRLVQYQAATGADAECRENASAMTGELAAAYFAEWAKSKEAEALDAAEQLYSMHVAAVPADAAAKAQYAEVLWARAEHEPNAKQRRQRWERAATLFGSIDTPEAKRAAALAWMNAVDIVLPTGAKVALANPPRTPLHAWSVAAADAKLLAAIDAYANQATTDDDELAQMRLAAAITWRRYRHFDEAVTMLDAFLEHHQANARAELVANLLLDSMIQRGKPEETLDVVEAIAADTAFVDGKPELVRNLQLARSRSAHARR